jgi:hypothetical protein
MKLHDLDSYTELYTMKKIEMEPAKTWAIVASTKICNKPTVDFGTAMYNLDMHAIKIGVRALTDQVNFLSDKVIDTIAKAKKEARENAEVMEA